jgi:Zn-dependent peptidase ImmA (M78 family)
MKINTKLEIQSLAAKFREEHGISPSEPIKIKSILTKLKVNAFFLPLNDNISGMSMLVDELRFMFINSKQVIGRQNFTIFHELYHLFMQVDFDSMICNTGTFNPKDPVEYYADWFSAYLLMPREGILNKIPKNELQKNKITIITLLELENYFGCSRTALLYRLNELNLIDLDAYECFKSNIKTLAKVFGYGTKLYEPGRENIFISDYGKKAKKLYDDEIISESKFISLLRDAGIELESGVMEDVHS